MSNLVPVTKSRSTRYVKAEPGLIDAWNIPGFIQWINSLGVEKMHTLLRDNRLEFVDQFGEPTGTFRGEYYYRYWQFENGFYLLTARHKGTAFNVPVGTTLEQIQDFINQMLLSSKG